MAEVCIDCFHRIGLLFVGAHLVGCPIVKSVIGRKGIRVILFGLGCLFQTGLQDFGGSCRHDLPTQDASGISIYDGEDVDFVFFLPTKVNNSSNSAFFYLLGQRCFRQFRRVGTHPIRHTLRIDLQHSPDRAITTAFDVHADG